MRPRAIVMAVALMVAPPSWGQEAAEAVASFGNEGAQQRLWIKGATDIPFIAPALQAFVEARPEFYVTFESWNSNDLYRSAVTDCRGDDPVADLLISSSVDQQVKLETTVVRNRTAALRPRPSRRGRTGATSSWG